VSNPVSFVVDQQAVNLLLKFAVDFIEHFKANQLIADLELVTILQESLVTGRPLRRVPLVESRSVKTIAALRRSLRRVLW